MKRKIPCLFFIFLAVSIFTAKSQDTFKHEWTVGASFGANLSQASFNNSYSASPISTKLWQQYQGGIAIRYISEKNLGVMVELNYSQQGWSQDFVNREEKDQSVIAFQKSLEHKHQLNYLDVPFLAHIYFGNKVRFFINLGPKIGFLLSEKETFNEPLLDYLASGDFPSKTPSSREAAQYFRKTDRKIDYGIVVGMGLEFRTGIGHFGLEGRYNYGLGDFYSNKKADPFQKSANAVIGVKINYFVKLF